MDIAIRCFGQYSYQLNNPILFYKNVCGNVDDEFTTKDLDSQLKSELLTALQPAFAQNIRDRASVTARCRAIRWNWHMPEGSPVG